MFKNIYLRFTVYALLPLSAICAEDHYCANEVSQIEEDPVLETQAAEVARISESFGHIIAKHIDSLGIEFDIVQIAKGLQEAKDGKLPPLNEIECIQAISEAREQAFLCVAKENLEKANLFMTTNAQESNIQIVEDGKLQYKIAKEGYGSIVEKESSPLIRYKGTFIDGTTFASSTEDDLVMLDETISGFGRGLIGMKEGEKRILYIHPDLAYGTQGQLPPNSLLIFEIDLIKADGKEEGTSHIISSEPESSSYAEIATPKENTGEAIR